MEAVHTLDESWRWTGGGVGGGDGANGLVCRQVKLLRAWN